MNILDKIADEFEETLALMILEGGFDQSTEYRVGWLTAYGQAYKQMTGRTMYQLVNRASKRIEGSGKSLKV